MPSLSRRVRHANSVGGTAVQQSLPLLRPLERKRSGQPRQPEFRRLLPVQDRLDDVRREQRQPQEAAEVTPLDRSAVAISLIEVYCPGPADAGSGRPGLAPLPTPGRPAWKGRFAVVPHQRHYRPPPRPPPDGHRHPDGDAGRPAHTATRIASGAPASNWWTRVGGPTAPHARYRPRTRATGPQGQAGPRLRPHLVDPSAMRVSAARSPAAHRSEGRAGGDAGNQAPSPRHRGAPTPCRRPTAPPAR